MFYSLSLAMGIMITYGSYMQKSDNLEQSVRRIELFDTGYAFLAGLMIVPAAFVAMGSAEAVASKSGPSLMFVILPTVFDQMGGIALDHGLPVLPARGVRGIDQLHRSPKPACPSFRTPRTSRVKRRSSFPWRSSS